MQPAGPGHETLVKLTSLPAGTFRTDHRAPSQRSASGPDIPPPTARQPAPDQHDTAVNRVPLADLTRMPRQRDPSHRSMKIDEERNRPVRVRNVDPTATQNRLETHDTPSNEPDRARPIAGATATRHSEPFQRPITGVLRTGLPVTGPPGTDPTATQNVLDVHDSEVIAPLGAERCNNHIPPLHTSASPPFGPAPTATQNLAEGHDTAASCPVAIGGAGTARTVQFAADAPSTQPKPNATIEPKNSVKAGR